MREQRPLDSTGQPAGNWPALVCAVREGGASLIRHALLSLVAAATIALGVGIALAIGGTGRAAQRRVTELLEGGPLGPMVDPAAIYRVLAQASTVLSWLALAYTAALVVSVTVLSQRAMQGEIALRLARGARVWEVVAQLVTQAVLLSLVGATVGLGVGVGACALLDLLIADLTVRAHPADARLIFVEGIALGTVAMLGVAVFFVTRRPPAGDG